MNKSLLTNLSALGILLIGFLINDPAWQTVGMFAVSGAVTNWLAIHMLFERVPGLYGSGVVPRHFDEFRRGIRTMIMTQFFSTENIQRLLTDSSEDDNPNLDIVLEQMDFSPTFDGLISTIEESSFAGILSMMGGAQGLSGLRQPFIAKMKTSLRDVASSESVQIAIRSGIRDRDPEEIRKKIESIVDLRLQELTPEMVKEIVQGMIQRHLGWLVVWGGVFGGLIGLVATQIT